MKILLGLILIKFACINVQLQSAHQIIHYNKKEFMTQVPISPLLILNFHLSLANSGRLELEKNFKGLESHSLSYSDSVSQPNKMLLLFALCKH